MRSIIFILAFLFFTNFLFAQNLQKLVAIRKAVQAINADSGYKLKTLDNDYFVNAKNEAADNGQELKGYYKGDKLKKIIYKAGLSNCLKTYEYYLDDDGELIFLYEKEDDFLELKDHSGLDHTKLAPAFDARYYFDDSKLIETKVKGEERSPNPDKNWFFVDLKTLVQDLKSAK